MIDCWLILCQLVPFAQVVLLTAMECLREEKQEKQRKGKKAKRKRKREQKKKTSTENNTEGDLQVVKDKTERGTEQDLPFEAWTRGQPTEIKYGLVANLVVIGKCLLCLFAHLVVWADVEDADMLGDGLPLAQGRGHGAARLADQERLT